MSQYKIGVITVWLGEFPDTFELWVKSVEYNPDVNFIFITDQDYESKIGNLKIVKMTLEEIKQLAIEKLGMNIVLPRAYKLCDFKPVYGVIFDEYIKGYDYWGCCDIDLIFGNITHFTELYELKKYDKFLDEGHFALYRNTDECNNYYKKCGSYYNYDEVFTSENNFVFDERNRINNIYLFNGYPLFQGTIYANINPAFERFQCCRLKNYKHQVFYWEKGTVYRAFLKGNKVFKEEFCYIHLLKRKLPKPNDAIINSTAFYITDKGYYLKAVEGCPDLSQIKKFSFYRGLASETKMRVRNYYKHNWSISGIKRRLTTYMFKYKWGRKLLHKNF
ncbi:MAG: hypothetical protein IJC69_08290 [Clostridia bacterium]|nr:hypothetical protein [Clostridia bacterium]